MYKHYNSFEEFLTFSGQKRIFSLLEKRTPGDWTPLEMAEKYIDQDQYVDTHYKKVLIVETITLPDGDILIGYKDITYMDEDDSLERLAIEYRKLSCVELSFFPLDMEEDEYGGFI